MSGALAVVPIFVNAGAAVLPAVLAAAASAAALLLKPRELLRVMRNRPLVVLVSLLALGGAGAGVWLLEHGGAGGRKPAEQASGGGFGLPTDFTQLALQIIAHDQGMDRALLPLWNYAPEDSSFISSPVARDDRVYCASLEIDSVGLTGSIYCLDASNKALIWKTSDAGDAPFHPFFSTPALSDDGKYLVIGQGLHADRDCEILCLDTASGKVHWRVKTPLHVESSPAIHGDFVVVGAGAIEGDDHKAIGDPGQVIAIRISDGQELWRAQVNDPESSPAIGPDGIVYIGSGFNGNAVVALRPETDAVLREKKLDRVLWRFATPYPVTSTIVLSGDLVLCGGGKSDYVFADPDPAGVVLAIDRSTGQLRWKTELPDSVLGRVCVVGNIVFCPVRNGQVAALDVRDGHLLWKREVNGSSPLLAGIVMAGEDICAVSRDGTLGLLNIAGGAPNPDHLFQINAADRPGDKGLCYSTPFVVGDRLYVGTETAGLRCYRLNDPQQKLASRGVTAATGGDK